MNAANRTTKAAMIAEKDRLIVLAAREHFLRDGFAGASMDAIARSATVSVKTIYGHFRSKDELFSRVMIEACTDHLLSGELPSDEALGERFVWYTKATQRGLFEAGREYLGHLLSEEQLALYRVVTRDADRFPALGRQYHENFARGRTGILVAYLRSVGRRKSWKHRNPEQDAALYEALLRQRVYEEVLHGLTAVSERLINEQAEFASRTLWKLMKQPMAG